MLSRTPGPRPQDPGPQQAGPFEHPQRCTSQYLGTMQYAVHPRHVDNTTLPSPAQHMICPSTNGALRTGTWAEYEIVPIIIICGHTVQLLPSFWSLLPADAMCCQEGKVMRRTIKYCTPTNTRRPRYVTEQLAVIHLYCVTLVARSFSTA